MMGTQHAACGAAAWVVVASDYELSLRGIAEPLAQQFTGLAWLPDAIPLGMGLLDVGPGAVLIGAIICAGAALLPDIDHHNASIAHSLPPFSMVLARFFQTISGGHRNGTHSLLGIVFFGIVAWLAGLVAIPNVGPFDNLGIGAGLLAVILSAFAFKVLHFMPARARKAPWAAGIAIGILTMMTSPDGPWWLVINVMLGVAVHIAGDMLTKEGCNLTWPLRLPPPDFVNDSPLLSNIWGKNGYMSVPILGSADSIRAWALTIPISAVAIVGMCIAGITWAQEGWVTMLSGF